MYKLVIVDDENDIRSRLARLIEQSGCNFEIIAQYENGIDAYDGITADSPDLIITDIKIPYINGIDLIKRVREATPLVKAIVITGFNEFDYAKEAANLGVIGFVSKPITREDIGYILKRAEKLLDSEFSTAENVDQLQSFYEDSLPVIRENDLYRLSHMAKVSPAFERKLLHNGISLSYRYFVMGVFDFDHVWAEKDAENEDLSATFLREAARDRFSTLCEVDLFSRYEKFCVLFKSNDMLDLSEIEQAIEQVILRVSRYTGMSLSAGISNVQCEERDFSKMMIQAQRAMEYRSIMGGNRVFSFGAATATEDKAIEVDDGAVKELRYFLRFGSAEDSAAILEGIRRQAVEHQGMRTSYYYVVTEVLNTLVKSCDNVEALYTLYDGSVSLYRRVIESKTAEEAFELLAELCSTVRKLNDETLVDNVERSMRKVLTYMDNHYCDADISFESMAREIGLSVSYISALFRKNLNTTFVKHLTALRMEHARELLTDSSRKIVDIAQQLGYADPYYFSHCFKKYTGHSPKEYRNNG